MLGRVPLGIVVFCGGRQPAAPRELDGTAFAQKDAAYWLGAPWLCGPGSVCCNRGLDGALQVCPVSFRCYLRCRLFAHSGLSKKELLAALKGPRFTIKM